MHSGSWVCLVSKRAPFEERGDAGFQAGDLRQTFQRPRSCAGSESKDPRPVPGALGALRPQMAPLKRLISVKCSKDPHEDSGSGSNAYRI